MSHRLISPPKDELVALYSTTHISISKLAKHYNTSNPTIRKWLIDYQIPRKSQKTTSQQVNLLKRKCIPDKQLLTKLYNINSIDQLEMIFSVGQETIYSWLNHHCIPIKTHSHACLYAKHKRREAMTPSKQQVIDQYNKDGNIKVTASHFDLSYSFMKKIIDQYKIHTVVPNRSAGEIELLKYCQYIRPDCQWISCDRNMIAPYELDIYCPELKFAIEYCGLYWHSQYFGCKDPQYHKMKYDMCKGNDIRLITVFESDDINKIKKLIKHKIGQDNPKVYARKTSVKEISSDIANAFHNKYHIHRSVGSKVHLGLYHDDDLLQVCSFGTSRFSKKYQYEITRMTIGDTVVVGGFSKLLKHFILKHNPKSIVTFSDLRFGNGDVYRAANMTFDGETQPNYFYFYKNVPILSSRTAFQKHKLRDKLKMFDDNLTEFANMRANGYDKIWDCGNNKFSMILLDK